MKDHRGNVTANTIHCEMTVVYDLASLSPAIRPSHPENNVIQTALKSLKQVQTSQAVGALSSTEITAELAFQNTINPARLLFGTQLARVIRYTLAATAATTLTVLTRRKPAALESALGRKAALALQE
jgi:hypothetical protein